MSCSLLTSWFYSLSFFSCGDAMCGTPLLLWLFLLWTCHMWYFYGLFATCTTIGTTNGSTLPLIILCALTYGSHVPSSLLSMKLLLPQLLRTLLGKFVIAFFLFSGVICISSLIFKNLG
jgi:hypothetical protein